ncbi:hypothetical protein [Oceanobacillus kapialis]|uniref:Uncharacterized protein n=1 Tax=Oceanobacillus kapialis TaxID=481353 RepID=A0ABW5Q412_9BACI
MKTFTLVGKINLVLGTSFFIMGIFLLILEISDGFSLKETPMSIAFTLIGISIFMSALFYKVSS